MCLQNGECMYLYVAAGDGARKNIFDHKAFSWKLNNTHIHTPSQLFKITTTITMFWLQCLCNSCQFQQ